ncbi:MAG: hypothetical protein ACTSU5_01330, partial [Promethearchaeota archaeon]
RFDTLAEAEVFYTFQNRINRELDVFFEEAPSDLLSYTWHYKLENVLDRVYKHFHALIERDDGIDEIGLNVNGVRLTMKIKANPLPPNADDYIFEH